MRSWALATVDVELRILSHDRDAHKVFAEPSGIGEEVIGDEVNLTAGFEDTAGLPDEKPGYLVVDVMTLMKRRIGHDGVNAVILDRFGPVTEVELGLRDFVS
jgi:hypothetical protein